MYYWVRSLTRRNVVVSENIKSLPITRSKAFTYGNSLQKGRASFLWEFNRMKTHPVGLHFQVTFSSMNICSVSLHNLPSTTDLKRLQFILLPWPVLLLSKCEKEKSSPKIGCLLLSVNLTLWLRFYILLFIIIYYFSIIVWIFKRNLMPIFKNW